MARKTKEEAELTRCSILDAAEQVFQTRGAAGTSLQHIADAAGVTRGAVYWHFKDKADLFNAMMERVCLPFEESTEAVEQAPPELTLKRLREHFAFLLDRTQSSEQVRRVFSIATQMVEYNGELAPVRERRLQWQADHVALLERALRAARKAGQVSTTVPLKQAAMGLHALFDGLLQNWLLQPESFDLRRVGQRTLDLYLAGLCAGPRSDAASSSVPSPAARSARARAGA